MKGMENDIYSSAIEKAKTVLAGKKTTPPWVNFSEICVSQKYVEIFRFVTKARRIIMRRLGL